MNKIQVDGMAAVLGVTFYPARPHVTDKICYNNHSTGDQVTCWSFSRTARTANVQKVWEAHFLDAESPSFVRVVHRPQ